MDVVVFRLLTGQDVIAQQVEPLGSFLKVKRPLIAMPTGAPDGGVELGFMRMSFLFADDDVYEIPVTALSVLPVKAADDLETSYIQNVTGLTLASAAGSQILHS